MSKPQDIRYSYNDVPTIRDFAGSDAFFRALVGPVGAGKSSGSAIEIPSRAFRQRPDTSGVKRTRWAVIRNSYPMLRDTTIKTFFQWLPPEYFGKYYASEHRYVVKAFEQTEIEILFRALDRPDDIKNLLSLELTGAWVNEGREIPWPIFDALQGRVGRFPPQREGGPTWFGLWTDTNPPDADSKFYKFFEETKHKPDFAQIFKQPSGLSPEAENLTALPGGRRYYETLSQGKGPEWVKVYVHGQYGFVVDGKPVYPEYSDRIHCHTIEPVEEVTIYRGFDFGLTPSCVFSQLLPDGRWLVFDEMVSESMGIDRFSDEVLNHCARSFNGSVQFVDIGDPAGKQRAQTDEKTCFEILQSKGIQIEAGEQSPALRQESVRKPLRTLVGGEAQFILHPRCKMLRKGFQGGYQYRRLQVSADRYTSTPDKNVYSHCHDALQYVGSILFGAGLIRPKLEIEDVSRADYTSDVGRSSITGY